ncbi:MAG: poly-gamma-glutamate synthase PgsB/CapB [Myxococcota bacterium]|jgi:poly-gamma-glutamate synthase PgsB/CapB
MKGVRRRTDKLSPRARALAELADPFTARVRGPELCWLASWPELTVEPGAPMAAGLVAAIAEALEKDRESRDAAARLNRMLAEASPDERRPLLAGWIRQTVPVGWRRWGDLRALRRDLDGEALLERLAGESEEWGARIEVAIRVLEGVLCADPATAYEWLQVSGAESTLSGLASAHPRPATRREAARTLARTLAIALRRDPGLRCPGLAALANVVSAARLDVWTRRAALEVLGGLPGVLVRDWLERIDDPEYRDAFLLIDAALRALLARPEPWVHELAADYLEDPSPTVRFRIADGWARRLTEEPGLREDYLRLLEDDPDPEVRAWACTRLTVAPGHIDLLQGRLYDVPLVARAAVETALAVARRGTALPDGLRLVLSALVKERFDAIGHRAAVALATDDASDNPASLLATRLSALRTGQRRTVVLPPEVTVDDLARALVPHVADGFGFWLDPSGRRVTVRRGDTHVVRLWRMLHELRHPGPAKRQAHSHAVGRADQGPVRVPPLGLAEASPTSVPGERALAEGHDSWVPEVPMVDDYLDSLRWGTVQVVHAEGVTRVQRPSGIFARMWARLRLTWSYGVFDQHRRNALDGGSVEHFLHTLGQLGFRTELPGKARVSVWPALPWLVSSSTNTLAHLTALCVLLAASLLGQITVARLRLARARAQIPLVIGGWGTRGKSGTERMKAALFQGLGVPVLSKTTGTEAILLHGAPGSPALEMFLFRPFDKASIWEQADVVRLAPRLGARVMLWECMALNPRYVDILQSAWMRDDLATLTNAYPDHEDIQGPTGGDVAVVLGRFAPPDGHVLTTEQNMFPVLEEMANRTGATCELVPLGERELVPADLMARMPYREHPANVALTAEVAARLGIERVEAIGLMADNAMPDLGALIAYPPVRHLGREITFVNGMSANDTLSFRHNWSYAGFADQDDRERPDLYQITVINNRHDRVPRSRVFARIIAEHAPAHRHVLIGTNLRGFMNFLAEAVQARLDAVDWSSPEDREALFRYLRPVEPGPLGDRCASRLGAPEEARLVWLDACRTVPKAQPSWAAARGMAESKRGAAEALERACGETGGGLADHLVDAFARRLAFEAALDASESACRRLYADLAEASVRVLSDASLSGDAIIDLAIDAAPPGCQVRLLGCQNIKGTGLDFAYQWVRWRAVHGEIEAIEQATGPEQLAQLDALKPSSLTCVLHTEAVLSMVERLRGNQDLFVGLRTLDAAVRRRRKALLGSRSVVTSTGPLRWLLIVVERLIDPFDAVLRRRRARRVLEDLATQRVGHRRAATVLAALTKRQKGGWLSG